jgi:hypothetical protein
LQIRIVVAGLIGACFLSAAGAAAEPVRVALLPIVVHSAEPETAYLSSGLADMLTARLEQTGGITVVSVQAEGEGPPLPAAMEAGRRVNAAFVVFASFTQFGEGASFDVRCAPVGESDEVTLRRVFIQSGALGDIIPKLDDLSARIARFVGAGDLAEASAESNGAGSGAAGDEAVSELRERVEALERAVYIDALEQAEPASATSAEDPEASTVASELR